MTQGPSEKTPHTAFGPEFKHQSLGPGASESESRDQSLQLLSCLLPLPQPTPRAARRASCSRVRDAACRRVCTHTGVPRHAEPRCTSGSSKQHPTGQPVAGPRATKTGHLGTKVWGQGQRGCRVLQERYTAPGSVPDSRGSSTGHVDVSLFLPSVTTPWAQVQSGRDSRDGGRARANYLDFPNSHHSSQSKPKPAKTRTRSEGAHVPATRWPPDNTQATVKVETAVALLSWPRRRGQC